MIWRIVFVCCLVVPLAAFEIHSSIREPSDRKAIRRGRQLNIIKFITTTTTTTTVSTSTICAKLVNVTGACFRIRNQWVNEPIVMSFDEDLDDIDELFRPPSLESIEITTQPVQIVEKTVAVESGDTSADGAMNDTNASEEYDVQYDYEEDYHNATDDLSTYNFANNEHHNLFQETIQKLNMTDFSMADMFSAFEKMFGPQPLIESSMASDVLPQIQPDLMDLYSRVVAFMDGDAGNKNPPPKKHRQKRQGPAGLFLIFLQLLFFAVASSGFNGNLQNIFRPNGLNQEVELQTPNTNIPIPQTQYTTSTSTETVTVYSTTATATIFIQGCTPNPLPYGQCARRRDLQFV